MRTLYLCFVACPAALTAVQRASSRSGDLVAN